jgi:O-methyltransferase
VRTNESNFASSPVRPKGYSRRLVQVMRTLGFKALRKYTPKFLNWCDAKLRQRAVFNRGFRLVPEAELERSYEESIHLLRSKGVELGDYLEFGVYCGSSLACMHRTLQRLNIQNTRLFGFDSFEGFPDIAKDDSGGEWKPGAYKFDLKAARKFLTISGVDWRRVFLIKGLYCDTLDQNLTRKYQIDKASLIMIDCDLYSSSKEALDYCAPLIKDYAVIFFDDWNAGNGKLAKNNMGQKRAFDEFLKENPVFVVDELESYTSRANDWPDNAKVFLFFRAQ